MIQVIEIAKKYGVTGVLAMWLWHTDTRLNKVETALYDCYKTQSIVKSQASTSKLLLPEMFAVLPEKNKIKTKYGYVTI